MSHLALRVYVQPAAGTCIDLNTGACPYYRVIGDPGWEQAVCSLFPGPNTPFTPLLPADATGVPQRADDCFRAELEANHHDMISRTLVYTEVQKAMTKDGTRRRKPSHLNEVIVETLRRAIAASDGLGSAAEILGIDRHRLKRLVVKYGLEDAVEASRSITVKFPRGWGSAAPPPEFETPDQGEVE